MSKSPKSTKGILHIVATPIGNLRDITLRAIEILEEVSFIAAEDTRITRRLLNKYKITVKLISLHEHNLRAIPCIIKKLENGENGAYVTDAGTPLLSDPGMELVQAAAKRDIRVIPVPGPSAVTTAYSAAGLDGLGFRFFGFLPRKGKKRTYKLMSMEMGRFVSIFYEAPSRIQNTLAQLAEICGDKRQAVVFREMTKINEEIARGTLKNLSSHFSGKVKGEITVCVSGQNPESQTDNIISDLELKKLIRNELAKNRSVKDLAVILSASLDLPRKKVYQAALKEFSKK